MTLGRKAVRVEGDRRDHVGERGLLSTSQLVIGASWQLPCGIRSC